MLAALLSWGESLTAERLVAGYALIAMGAVAGWVWRGVAGSFPTGELRAANQELRRLEARTAEANRWLQLCERLAHVGHWRLSLPDLTLTWSDEIYRIYGLERTPGAAASLDAAFAAYHPEDRDKVRAHVARAIETRSGFQAESRVLRPDGEVRHVRSQSLVQLDSAGEPVSLFGVFIDITALKQEEAEAVAAGERRAAAQRLEALGKLAGGVAHDMNNVLQTISAGTDLIACRAGEAEETARLAAMIVRTTDRATSVVNRLLTFARRSDLRAEAIDARALLESLVEVLSHTLGGTVRVRLEAGPELPPIWADLGQLETVLVNLATNARDAMPGGGIIRLQAAAERVCADLPHQAGLAPGDYVRLSVKDAGTGMDAATLACALEPFFTTKPRGQGTGLGLSMANGFAVQSGGGLFLHSRPGQGTCVSLWLPQAKVQAAVRGPAFPPVGHTAAACRACVLLVDDENDLRALLAEDLERRGYEVLQAEGGEAALRHITEGKPVQILVTDLSMPGMDGLALIEAARARLRDLPALLLTGHAPDRASLAAYSACRLLGKPVRGAVLAAHIEELLGADGKRAPGPEPARRPALQPLLNAAM